MKYLKRVITFTFCAALLLLCLSSCATGTAFSLPTRQLIDETELSFGSFRYCLYDDGCAKITAYTGSEISVTVPDTINGARVVELGMDAFSDSQTLQAVKLNSSLEVIGDYCFYNCASLSEISIGRRVWSIGVAAFEGTPWLSSQTDEFVVVGDGVLLKYQGSALEVTVPAGIRHTAYAFSMNDQLISVSFTDELLTLGNSTFSYCTGLRRVELGNSLRMIGEGAFDGCESLTGVRLPDSLEVIGAYAFNYCNFLNKICLGPNVRTIGSYAFRNCLRMKLVSLPAAVTDIGEYAFADCYVLTLVIYDGSAEQFEALGLSSTNYILRDVDKIYLK